MPSYRSHLRLWLFLCEQKNVSRLADLKRPYILDYVDQRLNQDYVPTGVNYDLRSLHTFLLFLQEDVSFETLTDSPICVKYLPMSKQDCHLPLLMKLKKFPFHFVF